MKHTLKKLLSLLLALSMVASMIPVAFATETTEATQAADIVTSGDTILSMDDAELIESHPEETTEATEVPEETTEAIEAPEETTEAIEAPEETTEAIEAPEETTEAIETPEETTEATEAPVEATEPVEEGPEITDEVLKNSVSLRAAAPTGPNMTAAGMKIISKTTNNVAPGVTYDKVISRNANNQQNVGILTKVDLSENVALKASYMGYYNAGTTAEQRAAAAKDLSWGFQSTTGQAAAYESVTDAEGMVVIATNADYFNMGTGEPSGYLIMEGNAIKTSGEPYFAVLQDGTAVIRDEGTDCSDVVEAISGPFYLVKDGVSVAPDDPAQMPRNSIGICADGSVVFFQNDGRQAPTSVGMSLKEVAAVLLDAGCVDALYLDGGGSATVAARKEGASALEIVNSPSDGQEREVSSAMLVVSTAAATGVFHHASITPNDELYTPKSQIQFSATGVDTAGKAVEIPDDVVWTLAEDCADMGTIDANGLFTAGDKTGMVTVQLQQNGTCVGSAFVEIVSPDSIYFENEEISLGFEDTTDFNLVVRYLDRDVNIKAGDIIWTTSNEKMGTFDGNFFTASDGESLNGEVTASSAFDPEVSGTIKVIVGMLPTIVWDFEDIVNEDGSITDSADYYIKEQGGILSTSNYGRGGKQSIEIVSIDDGAPVRFGEKSLKLNFDFTQCGAVTEGAVLGTSEAFTIPGTPTGIGVWVYAPEGVGVEWQGDGTQAGFWLRGYIKDSSTGGAVPYDFTLEPKAITAEMAANGVQPGIYWEGWKYLEADLTHLQAPFTILEGNALRLMFVNGTMMGTRTANAIYFDNFQFVYGTNVDDIDEPRVDSISVGNKELNDGDELTSSTISLRTTFSDVQNKYTSGVDASTVRMYIDGVNVVNNAHYNFALNANDGYAELYDLQLLDGKHSVTVSLRDKFGNDTEETRYFTVNSGKAASAVTVTPVESEAFLGSKVTLQVKAADGDIASVENIIRLSNRFPVPEITFSENYTGSSSYNKTSSTLTLSAVRKADASAEDDNLIATITVSVPSNLTRNDSFLYEVKSGSYTTSDDRFYTYSAAEVTLAVDAQITVFCDPILVGGSKGVLKVTDLEGKSVAGANIYLASDGSLIGTTDENGLWETDYFSTAAATVTVYAENAEGMPSFHYNVFSFEGSGATDAAPSKILFNACEDSTTQKSLSWISNPNAAGTQSIRYRAEGTEEWTIVAAQTKLLTFVTGGNKAAHINNVVLKDLTPGTSYEYQVGTGELWSEIDTMATSAASNTTKFFVMADIQADDLTNVKTLVNNINKGGYDFGIQTGDAIDNVTNYGEVEGIVNLLGNEMLKDTDMIRVLGNHEYYGDDDAVVASTLYNLPNAAAGSGYSVTYGNVYVATIHFTNTEAELKSALEWLVADAKASDAEWKVLALHQPPYYTNAAGGNKPVYELVPDACEEAGIDVVFSGHDHSLARTNQLTDDEVDTENGILYYIGGSSGEKSYPISSQGIFDFSKIFAFSPTVNFSAIYLGVTADDLQMTLNIYDVAADGSEKIVDSYTLYTKKGTCTNAGHALENAVYDKTTGEIICNDCNTRVDPVEKDYTDFARDLETGRLMYLIKGVPQTGKFLFDEDTYYFDETGVAYHGDVTLDEVAMKFDNGKLIGGHTGFLKKSDGNIYHYHDGEMTYGWLFEGEELYHFNTTTGVMTTGTKVMPDEEAESKNAYYDFDDDGRTLRGYFNPAGYYYWGGLPKVDSWVKSGADADPDAWYRTNGHGHHVTDRTDAVTVKIEIDGVVYTFDNSNGKLLDGCIVLNEDDTWSYYWAGEAVNDGWFQFDGKDYYAFEDGTLATGSTVIDGKAYMFTEQGALITEGIIMTAVLNESETAMNVKICNTERVNKMRIAIWNAEAPQEDTLRWFDAEQNAAGDWAATVPMCEFNKAGKYFVHAYATIDGTETLLVDTTAYAKTAAEHTYAHEYDEKCNICGAVTRDLDIPSAVQYRMYNPNTGEHFYTGSMEEQQNLINEGWSYEGVAFSFPMAGEPVFRLFNAATGEHLYTMDMDEVNKLVSDGWNKEGISFNSDSKEEVPQYRLHNPNATVGAYHYTGSVEERDHLISLGWEYQGIGWYSCWK